ncbi:hypothetical protein AB0I98_25895 [Streptomyces sp. NPDC050211]|uniref:hypothetical protein n=1 Tax=Streptomyces sp. NPDC050211 TaxID=3154932 RepID=UPI00341C48E9
MVTSTHEASHRIFAEHPEALAPVYEALGVPPPTKEDVREVTPDTTEIRPLERRADTVLKVEPPEGEHYVLAIEFQTKPDPNKASSWAYYVAFLRAKYDMPVLLVVVCKHRSTAKWAAGPFECGLGTWTTQVTRPFVLGPETVPEITDEAMAAQQPAQAVVSAIVHSDSKKSAAILTKVAHGWQSYDNKKLVLWCETMETGLENTQAKEIWRKVLMTVMAENPGRQTLFEEMRAEGRAKGMAEGKVQEGAALILRALDKRGIPVPEDARERITSCTDLDTLTLWFDRSLTATTAEELFAEDPEVPRNAPEQA